MKPQIGSVQTDRFIIDYFRFGIGKTPLVILPGMGLKSVISSADALGCECVLYDGYSHAVYDEAPDYRTHLKRFFEAEGN